MLPLRWILPCVTNKQVLSSRVRSSRIARAPLKIGRLILAWANSQTSSGVLFRNGKEDCGGTGAFVGSVMVDRSVVLIRTPSRVRDPVVLQWKGNYDLGKHTDIVDTLDGEFRGVVCYVKKTIQEFVWYLGGAKYRCIVVESGHAVAEDVKRRVPLRLCAA